MLAQYSYDAGTNGKGHRTGMSALSGASTNWAYDANGNLLSGAGRAYTWTFENRLSSVSQTSGSESYSYDADGERVKVVRGSTTTLYLEGLWEEVAGGAAKAYYTFKDQVVAVRDRSTNVITYLHGDHLSSVSIATTSGGALASQQEYTPFGSHRGSGDITQTTLDYTGQRLDGTGLLYYHARYYDSSLGRFISPDSIVPEVGALTVTPSDEMAAELFKQGGKGKGGKPTAPQSPQELNRYSYADNNPVLKNDPSGHCSFIGIFNGDCYRKAIAIYLSPKATTAQRAGAFAYAQLNLVPAAMGTALAGLAAGPAVSAAVTASTTETTVAAGGRDLIDLTQVNQKSQALHALAQAHLDSENPETAAILQMASRRQAILLERINTINNMPGDQLKGEMLRALLHDLQASNQTIERLLKK